MQVAIPRPIGDVFARLLAEGRADPAYAEVILSLLDTAMDGETEHAITLLPATTCAAHGGEPQRATPACAAWLAIRVAAKTLDDVEDRDLQHDEPVHVNAATGLLALAPLCTHALIDEGVPRSRATLISAELARAIVRAGSGQHGDLVAQRDSIGLDPEGWLAVAAAKSGALFAWATWAGAAIAGARGARLEAYRRFGESLGVLLQIADDYNDMWITQPNGGVSVTPMPDASNLAIAYARFVADDATRQRLDQDAHAARQGDADAAARLRAAVMEWGGQTFVLAAGRTQYRLAIEGLRSANPQPTVAHQLVALLDGIMPVLAHFAHDDATP
jgi:geranylgeranyl pyrophosphate synthase